MVNAFPGVLLSFRPMALQDVARVHEIDMLSFTMPWSERSYRFELTENENSLTWVAEIKNTAETHAAAKAARPVAESTVQPPTGHLVVGMVVIWAIMDEAHIATLAIHPDYRGLGIGPRLLARGLLDAFERGARLAYLEVRRSNVTAQRVYEQFGFQIAGMRPHYYKDNNEDALLMILDQLVPETISTIGNISKK